MRAVMEAYETSCAEDAERLCMAVGSVDDLRREGKPVIDFDSCPKLKSVPDAHRLRRWVEGRDLMTGQPVLLPYELVGVDSRQESPWDRQAFVMTSAGTAAHPDPHIALRSALLEAIENDAMAHVEALPRAFRSLRQVAPPPAGPLADLVHHLTRNHAAPTFLDATTEVGMPVALCLLADRTDGLGRTRARPFGGSACRPVWEQAAMAALLEAVQSRATDIAGARDDIRQEDFARAEPGPTHRPVTPPPPAAPWRTAQQISRRLAEWAGRAPVVVELAPPDGPSCPTVLVPGFSVAGGRLNAAARRRLLAAALP